MTRPEPSRGLCRPKSTLLAALQPVYRIFTPAMGKPLESWLTRITPPTNCLLLFHPEDHSAASGAGQRDCAIAFSLQQLLNTVLSSSTLDSLHYTLLGLHNTLLSLPILALFCIALFDSVYVLYLFCVLLYLFILIVFFFYSLYSSTILLYF